MPPGTRLVNRAPASPERLHHDVIVVGGGPAGSAVTLLLARAGFDVLLVERSLFPRRKACGECLSPQVARLLDDLGVSEAVEASGPARLAGWRVVAPNGNSFESVFRDITDDPGLSTALAIGRDRFDSILLNAAIENGADLAPGVRVLDLPRDGTGVVGMGPSGRFEGRARLVVGADGLRSVVSRRIGAPARSPRLRKLSLTGHLEGIAADEGNLGEMHLADGMCVGVAPVDADSTVHNVSLVVDGPRFGRAVATEPIDFFRRSLQTFPRLRRRVRRVRFADTAAGGRGGPLLTSGPFDIPTRRIVSPGYALVGDAAGYFDPFTGQGIFQALAGARMLAAEAGRALGYDSDPPLLVSYEKKLRRLVRGARALQHIIEGVISRPTLADWAIARLARRPAAGRALLAATGDLMPVSDALSPAVLLGFLAPWGTEKPQP